MTKNEMLMRTKLFALRIIKLVESLPSARSSSVVGKQLLRSGTSVGANYRAACRAKSSKDFVAKLAIVEEETDESMYWLELLIEAKLIKIDHVSNLYDEANQILSIVVASIKTMKRRPTIPKSQIQNPKSL